MMVVKSVRDGHDLPFKIDRFHFSREEIDSLEELSHGIDDICEIEITGCDFVQHRCKQKEVVAANEANLHCAVWRQQFLEINRSINSTETTAENDDSFFAWPACHPSDHRVLSVAKLAGEAVENHVDATRAARTATRFLYPVAWTALLPCGRTD